MTEHRTGKVKTILEEQNLDALLVNSAENRYYLSGFTGTAGFLLIGKEEAFLVTDFRYTEQARAQAPSFNVQRFKNTAEEALAQLAKGLNWQKIGFEARSLTFQEHLLLKKHFNAELLPLAEPLDGLRAVKDEAELKIIRQGAAKTSQAFLWLLGEIFAGQSEAEISQALEIYLLKAGASGPSFDFIVASGARGALPHAVASDKIMRKSELVTIDFGAVFKRYCTDMTRTIALGEPGEHLKEVYAVVLKAQQAALGAIKPGIKGKEADQAARAIIEAAGYQENFGHGLGHGVGLKIHEYPTLNAKSEEVLKPGMVVTVEPGIYLPGLGGVRIEDMVLITETGAEILTPASKELFVL